MDLSPLLTFLSKTILKFNKKSLYSPKKNKTKLSCWYLFQKKSTDVNVMGGYELGSVAECFHSTGKHPSAHTVLNKAKNFI